MTKKKHCSKTEILISQIKQIETEDELNIQVKELQNYFQVMSASCKPIKIDEIYKNPNKQKTCSENSKNKHEIQGLYQLRKHRAVQISLLGSSVYCVESKEEIEKNLKSRFSKVSESNICKLNSSLWEKSSPPELENVALTKPFTAKEVKRKLSMKIKNHFCNSRSPGMDNITFYTLNKWDFDCSILTEFFNACLKLETVPKCWNLTISTLVKKNEQSDNNQLGNDIKNWDVFTMQDSMSKLFQSLIASRLIVWSKNSNRLTTQKGYQTKDAACENAFILQECQKYAQKYGKDLACAWLDFRYSSSKLSYQTVLLALERHLVPRSIRNIICKLFTDSKTVIRLTRNKRKYTDPISLCNSLPQGSPLLPILTDLVMEPTLRSLSAESCKFQIFNQELNNFTTSNELTLIAESVPKLQNLLDIVEKISKYTGIKFYFEKCLTYYYNKNTKNSEKIHTSFFNQHLKCLPENEIETYFGVHQSLSIGQPGFPTIQELKKSVEDIASSELTPFQKIESIQLFIMPRAANCLRGLYNVSKDYLEEVDKILKNYFKLWLDLPEDASNESIIFHVSELNKAKQVKIEYLPLLDLLYIMKIIQAFNMLNSKDEMVKNIALNSLTQEVIDMLPKKPVKNITMEQLVKYLSGDLHVKNVKTNTIWQLVQTGISFLKIKINLTFKHENNNIKLVLTSNKKGKKGKRKDINLENSLKEVLIGYYKNIIKRNSECISKKDVIFNSKKEVSTLYPGTTQNSFFNIPNYPIMFPIM